MNNIVLGSLLLDWAFWDGAYARIPFPWLSYGLGVLVSGVLLRAPCLVHRANCSVSYSSYTHQPYHRVSLCVLCLSVCPPMHFVPIAVPIPAAATLMKATCVSI